MTTQSTRLLRCRRCGVKTQHELLGVRNDGHYVRCCRCGGQGWTLDPEDRPTVGLPAEGRTNG